jgi:outer membrane protein assembly factor BamA
MTAADDMALRVGDVNLILSAEYRFKALSWFEPAIFIDGGNIWTISDYADQPGGEFAWNRFYREMAVGAGLGLRFDLQFLVFRVDAGKRLRDPAMPEGERFIAAKRRFWQDWTPYIAIGYPF